MLLLFGVLLATALVLTACAGPAGPEGPAGPAGPAGAAGAAGAPATTADLTCSECHNDSADLSSKAAMYAASLHGSSLVYVEEAGRASCSYCHDGSAFSESVAAGLAPDEVEIVHTNATPQDCRACHQIHTTYTSADWALETTAPVAFYAIEGVTFDGGTGNLCASCHQPRRLANAAVDGMVTVDTSRYNPHHGPQSSMLLGTAGAGLEGKPSAHYSMVENTCVTCHLGEGDNHTFEPQLSACLACHADIEDFNVNSAQSELRVKVEELQAKLLAAGLIKDNGDGSFSAVTGSYTEAQANALWNWAYVGVEDKSMGAHNMTYANALIDASLLAFP